MILAHLAGQPSSPWRFVAHPEVWALVTAAVVGYLYLVRRVGPRVVGEGEPVVTRRQMLCYFGGVFLLWAGADYPIHDLGENYLYWVHMLQHMLFTMAVPPLLILGTPRWLQRWILEETGLDGFVKKLTRPAMAALLFAGVTAVSHAPQFVNYTAEHGLAHFGGHNLIFWSAMIMWFPVLNTMPDYPTMSAPVKMGYLFLQSLIPNVPVAFLTFADSAVYKHYATVPHPFGLSVVGDQQLAGAIMKIGGTLVLWSVILVVFWHWFRDEHAEDVKHMRRTPARPAPAATDGPDDADGAVPEVLTWEHVERELNRTKPPAAAP